MSGQSKWDYFKAIYGRYHKAPKAFKQTILDEFCRICGYHRKYAIRKLSGSPPQDKPSLRRRRKRPFTYSPELIVILECIWEAAGYPWSVRLVALVADWMPGSKSVSRSLRIWSGNSERSAPGRSIEGWPPRKPVLKNDSMGGPNPEPCSNIRSQFGPTTGM